MLAACGGSQAPVGEGPTGEGPAGDPVATPAPAEVLGSAKDATVLAEDGSHVQLASISQQRKLKLIAGMPLISDEQVELFGIRQPISIDCRNHIAPSREFDRAHMHRALAATQVSFVGRAAWQYLDHGHTLIREFEQLANALRQQANRAQVSPESRTRITNVAETTEFQVSQGLE